MKNRILVAVAAILCCGTWAVAQSTPDSSSPTSAGQSASSPSSSASSSGSSTTIDGCLAGSAGSYTLKDKATGTTYNLSGDTSKLSAHVGHEIRVTGSAGSGSASASSGAMGSSASSTSSNPSSASSAGGESFNVSSVKMVSSSCSAQ